MRYSENIISIINIFIVSSLLCFIVFITIIIITFIITITSVIATITRPKILLKILTAANKPKSSKSFRGKIYSMFELKLLPPRLFEIFFVEKFL